MFIPMARGFYRDKDDEGAGGGSDDGKKKEEGSLLDAAKTDPAKAADQEAGGDADSKDAKPDAEKDGKAEPEKTEPGERPAWLKDDKFWDADKGQINSELMAKNLTELNAKFSRGENKALENPGDYEHGLDEDTAKAMLRPDEDGNDPLVTKVQEFAHANKWSQAEYSDFMKSMSETLGDIVGEDLEPFDMEGEKTALGPNGQALIDGMAARSSIFVRAGVFNDADVNEFKVANGTAAGLKMMEKIFDYYGESTIPLTPSHGEGLPSGQELSAMLNSEKYETDASYRAEVDALYEKVHPNKNPAR